MSIAKKSSPRGIYIPNKLRVIVNDQIFKTVASPPAAAAPQVHSAIVVSINSRSSKSNCQGCNLRKMCLPSGLTLDESKQVDTMFTSRRQVKKGHLLICSGEKFTSLFVICTGFFKSYVVLESGNQQVTGFRMAGEMLGLDGIASNQHTSNVIALEDAEVCTMPFHRVEKIVRDVSLMQIQLYKILSREIFFESETKLMLGMRAEVRLVAFLLNLVDRLHARGLSQWVVVLRMTRQEIGSYLGIRPETVSRIFSKLTKQGMLEVDHRVIRILRTDLLCDLADHLA